MRRKSDRPGTGERHVRDIRRATAKKWSSEEKIRIVLSGLRGEDSIAELCRREAQRLYYSCSKEFLGEACAAIGSRPRRMASGAWPATRRGRRPVPR